MNRRPLPPAPEWTYWVDPGRFLAGCYPGSPHQPEHERKLEALLDAGIRAVVSLMEPEELPAFRDYLPDLRRLAAERGVEVEWRRFPVQDVSVPSVPEMEAILDYLHTTLLDAAVYLHCRGGIGRTGTVVGCWLLERERAEPATVLEVLARLRRMDQRAGHVRSPETQAQVEFVKSWARRLG